MQALPKARTGIRGFDAISDGGLPRRLPSLITGASSSGKTMFAMEFLVRGASSFDEPGVLLSFEESAEDLRDNVASLGFDVDELVRKQRQLISAMPNDPSELVAAGRFDLEGLFVRLALAVAAVGARRVVLDTIEVLLTALGNEAIVRGELARLFRWLKERGLTTVVTGERGRAVELTRFGIKEYVSDCVLVLDQLVHDEVSTRRLRIVKYLGSLHGTNEYPFLITERGMMVMPITAVGLAYPASDERLSMGITRLDQMLSGGIYRGSTLLISGNAGTGKTTVAAFLLAAACRRGERALFITYEESPSQLIRNMRSVGIELQRWVDEGLLRIWAERSTAFGLEEHLGRLDRILGEFQPAVAAIDSIASLIHIGSDRGVTAALSRQIDLLKGRGITAVLTTLTHQGEEETSAMAVSSLTDTWLLLRNVESDGERKRLKFVIKSRGMPHSNQGPRIRAHQPGSRTARCGDRSAGSSLRFGPGTQAGQSEIGRRQPGGRDRAPSHRPGAACGVGGRPDRSSAAAAAGRAG